MKNFARRFFLRAMTVFLSVLFAPEIEIEADEIDHDLSSWPTVNITGIPLSRSRKVTGGLTWMPLMTKDLEKPSPFIFGGNVSYAPNKYVSFDLGYDNWLMDVTEGSHERYNRMHPYQQIVLNYKVKDLGINFRGRIEEISRDDFHNISVRSRNRLRLTHPLPSFGTDFNKEKKWYAIVSDEVHFNLNTKMPNYEGGFEENFFFTGLGRKFGKNNNISAELGYYMLFTKLSDASPKPYKMNHCIGTNLFIKIP